jgi:hypothetical protein
VRTSADDKGWPDPLTTFRPLSKLNDALAAQLVGQYLEVLDRELSDNERAYAKSFPAPLIEVGTEPGGECLLRISFGGGMTCVGWDGGEDDAVAVVNDLAINPAENASGDYWLDGGWRSQTTFTGTDSENQPRRLPGCP